MNQKFPYILRISEKAKHVRFQVSVEKGLEIVVPKRFSALRVPLLVEKNSQWIERAFQKVFRVFILKKRDQWTVQFFDERNQLKGEAPARVIEAPRVTTPYAYVDHSVCQRFDETLVCY